MLREEISIGLENVERYGQQVTTLDGLSRVSRCACGLPLSFADSSGPFADALLFLELFGSVLV